MKSDVITAQGLVEGGKQFFRNREKVTNVTKVASVLGTFTKFLKAARPLFNTLGGIAFILTTLVVLSLHIFSINDYVLYKHFVFRHCSLREIASILRRRRANSFQLIGRTHIGYALVTSLAPKRVSKVVQQFCQINQETKIKCYSSP